MTRVRIYQPGQGFSEHEGMETLERLSTNDDAVAWITLDNPSEEDMEAVREALHIHPIAMEDASAPEDRPRLRHYGPIQSIVFFAVRSTDDPTDIIGFSTLRMFLCPRALVTIADSPMPELDEAYVRWQNNVGSLEPNSEAPLYTVLDTIVDGYFPVTDAISERVDALEDRILQNPDRNARDGIFHLKQGLLKFRRVTSAGRDVVHGIIRHDESTPDPDAIYLRDVFDHLSRITDTIDTYRDLLSNVMDSYLSVQSNHLAESANRLNETMQVLASWSIILGSGTFIAGVYGMNVKGLPEASSPWGFVFATGLCLALAGGLYAVFRRKRWL